MKAASKLFLFSDRWSICCVQRPDSPRWKKPVEVFVIEAINNSIQHAYQGDPDHSVELEVTQLPGQLIFDVWDSGTPADAARINA